MDELALLDVHGREDVASRDCGRRRADVEVRQPAHSSDTEDVAPPDEAAAEHRATFADVMEEEPEPGWPNGCRTPASWRARGWGVPVPKQRIVGRRASRIRRVSCPGRPPYRQRSGRARRRASATRTCPSCGPPDPERLARFWRLPTAFVVVDQVVCLTGSSPLLAGSQKGNGGLDFRGARQVRLDGHADRYRRRAGDALHRGRQMLFSGVSADRRQPLVGWEVLPMPVDRGSDDR